MAKAVYDTMMESLRKIDLNGGQPLDLSIFTSNKQFSRGLDKILGFNRIDQGLYNQSRSWF